MVRSSFRGAPGHQKFATDYVLSHVSPTFIFFPSSGVLPTPLFSTIESRHNLAGEAPMPSWT